MNNWQILNNFYKDFLSINPSKENGFSNDEILKSSVDIPTVLKEWYSLFAQNTELVSGNDGINDPQELNSEDGFIEVYWESQMMWSCGYRETDSGIDDPPVYFKSNELDLLLDYGLEKENIIFDNLVLISEKLSTFLTFMPILQKLVDFDNTNWSSSITEGESGVYKKVLSLPNGFELSMSDSGFKEDRTKRIIRR